MYPVLSSTTNNGVEKEPYDLNIKENFRTTSSFWINCENKCISLVKNNSAFIV